MSARNLFKIECVEWAGEQKNGYGFSSRGGRKVYAHRLAYEVECGPVGRGRHVHHLCGNKLCVNVDHLVSASPKDHRGFFHSRRTKTHCIRGHERTPENLYGFTCKECHKLRAKDPKVREKSRQRSKAWYASKRAAAKASA